MPGPSKEQLQVQEHDPEVLHVARRMMNKADVGHLKKLLTSSKARLRAQEKRVRPDQNELASAKYVVAKLDAMHAEARRKSLPVLHRDHNTVQGGLSSLGKR